MLSFTRVGGPTVAPFRRTRFPISIIPGNPAGVPSGYDIILVIGDSLAAGLSSTGSYTTYTRGPSDIDMPGVYQFNGPQSSLAGVPSGIISSDITPIWSNNLTYDTTPGVDLINIGEGLGRSYHVNNTVHIRNAARRTLIVNMARGGSSITNGANALATGQWARGDVYYNQAIAQINSAIAAAKGQFEGSRFVGTLISLGSNDANNPSTLDQTTFNNALANLVDGLRADITEGSEAWVTMWSVVPGLAGIDGTTVRGGHDYVVAQRSNTYKVIPTDNGVDNLHPTPAALRQGGADTVTATNVAPEPQSVASFTLAGQSGVALDTDIVSNAFMVRGIGYGRTATLTVTNGTTSINGGAFSSSPQTVTWGDMVRVRVHSSTTAGVNTTAGVTITGPLGAGDAKSANFTVTTVSTGSTYTMPRASLSYGMLFTNNQIVPGTGTILQENI